MKNNKSKVVRFISTIEKQAENNLKNLIKKAKSSLAFGSILWKETGWNITESQSKDRGHKQRQYWLWFSQHAKNKAKIGEPFKEPFANFCKAFIRLRHEIGAQSCYNHMTVIRAFRYLYDELLENKFNPISLTRDHFSRAEKSASGREEKTSAYRIGVHLTEIARILDENRLTKVRLEYKSSLKRPESNDRLSDTAKDRRHKLMPKEEIFQALSNISSKITEIPDKIKMNIVKLLIFTGFRLGEALTLPSDTLIVETIKNQLTGYPEIDNTGKLKQRIGLRYWPEKGAEPRIKWLPTETGQLVRKIIEELLELTAEARTTADWLEKHPGKVNLPSGTLNDLLDMDEVANLLDVQDGYSFCRARHIPFNKSIVTKKYTVKWTDLEKALVAQRWDKPMLKLKNGISQPLSKSLCVVFFEQLGNQRPQKKWIVRPISEQNISDFLCGRTTIKSIFKRFKYLTPDGISYGIRTHQFRHFLNTLANEGGLTDIEIAWWFGRKHIGDNQAYDHRTAAQMTEKARQMLLSGEIIGPIADAANQLTPIDAKDFIATQVNAVHHTPYGLCLHDFAQNPCDKHLNCLSGCKEFHRTKGDQSERNNLKILKSQVTDALSHATNEANEETWGANNWVKHNEVILENVEKALAIDDDIQTSTEELLPVNTSSKTIGEAL